jgi:hypothetical protein
MSARHEDRLRAALAEAARAVRVAPDLDDLERRITGAARQRRHTVVAVGAAALVLVIVAAAVTVGWHRGGARRVAGPMRPGIVLAPKRALPLVSGPVATGDAAAGSAGAASRNQAMSPRCLGCGGGYAPYGGQADEPYALLYTQTDGDRVVFGVYANRYPSPAAAFGVPWWNPPGWCYVAGSLYVNVRAGDAVGQLWFSRYDAVRPGTVSGGVGVVGQPEGAPRWVAVVQAPAGAWTVRAMFPGGGEDESSFAAGVAVMTAPVAKGLDLGQDKTPTHIQVLDGTGQVIADQDLYGGSSGVAYGAGGYGTQLRTADGAGPVGPSECSPPWALPAAGPVQPVDPAGARAAVTAAWTTVTQYAAPPGPRAALVDDPTGVEAAMVQVQSSPVAGFAFSAQLPVREIVFADPTTAYLRYDLYVLGSPTWLGRFAEVRQVDGVWKVDRASVCRVLADGGGTCLP